MIGGSSAASCTGIARSFSGGLSRPNTVRVPRCSTASTGGAIKAFGRDCWRRLWPAKTHLRSPWSTALRCAPTAPATGAKGAGEPAIGRSRGGGTTKIRALADGAGRLYALMLTAGQVHDIHGGLALLASLPRVRRLVADKACANEVRNFLDNRGTNPSSRPIHAALSVRHSTESHIVPATSSSVPSGA